MTEQNEAVPGGAVAGESIPAEVRAANLIASQANAVTAIYGLSGSGKSGLADTAAEYAYRRHGVTTLVYAADLGGWGNKRLALLRAGVLRIWDPRNHENAFATMEMISLGAWPEKIEDAERGYARPDVKLVLPRSVRYTAICANGHDAARLESAAEAARVNVLCPTCGVQVTAATAARVKQEIVKPGLFRGVGLRVFDSLTAMNDWGGLQELPRMAAENELPRNASGGSLLGSATAMQSGEFHFGSGSMAQVGFMQSRSYVWLANIRSIADQVVPSIVIFGVEKSKADDESGGETILGPKIAGNARTSAVPGWVGNCLHASKEPVSDAPNAPLAYRLWLTNHIDPRDPRKIPYLAKHRGTPDGMPDFLEDPLPAAPGDASRAWSVFNMGVFFDLLQAQYEREAKRLAESLGGDLPGMATETPEDEVVGEVQARVTAVPVRGAVAGRPPGGGAIARPVAGVVAPKPAPVAAPAAAPVPVADVPQPSARPVAGNRPIAGAPPRVVVPVPAAVTAAQDVSGAVAQTLGAAAPTQPAQPSQPPKLTRPIARTAPRPPV